jgi:acetyl esterase/lipase
MPGLATAQTQGKQVKNVVYGMYCGLALLMDIRYPAQPNGYGVIYVPGSGWNASQDYDTGQDKDRLDLDNSSSHYFAPRLLGSGYTLFVVNHREGPHFHYPAPLEDVQRAVRFIRHNAKSYGIDPDRIGAAGDSSGGYMVAMLGVLDGKGDATNHDPVNGESAKVQCVAAVGTPTDLLHFDSGKGTPNVASFMGQLRPYPKDPVDSIEAKAYRAASPVTYASSSSAPMLLMAGDHDETVPSHQSELMADALRKAGAQVKLILLLGGGHVFAALTAQHPEWGDPLGEPSRWLDQHLKKPAASQ